MSCWYNFRKLCTVHSCRAWTEHKTFSWQIQLSTEITKNMLVARNVYQPHWRRTKIKDSGLTKQNLISLCNSLLPYATYSRRHKLPLHNNNHTKLLKFLFRVDKSKYNFVISESQIQFSFGWTSSYKYFTHTPFQYIPFLQPLIFQLCFAFLYHFPVLRNI